MRCIGPRAKDAELLIMIWEELHGVHQEGTLAEVAHVKHIAPRRKCTCFSRSHLELKFTKTAERFVNILNNWEHHCESSKVGRNIIAIPAR